jgi:hypothetical protein
VSPISRKGEEKQRIERIKFMKNIQQLIYGSSPKTVEFEKGIF